MEARTLHCARGLAGAAVCAGRAGASEGAPLAWWGVAWHLLSCCRSLHVVRSSRVCTNRWPSLLGTCLCALDVAVGVPLWPESWPRIGAPRLVWSGRSRCSDRLSRHRGAFPYRGAFIPGFPWRLHGARGLQSRTALLVPAAGPCRDGGAVLAPRCTRLGLPFWGCPWQVTPASLLGCVRCHGLACVSGHSRLRLPVPSVF